MSISNRVPVYFSRREDHPPVSMTTCLTKAINTQETAIKEKHIRSTIIGTYQIKGGSTFWECVHRLGLKEHQIICWKFCHVLHKVLREGHDQVLRDSQQFKGLLQDHGKFWGHLKSGYGELIKIYCNLLVVKLGFHLRNNLIPGNLELEEDKIFGIAGESEDDLFQLAVEMLDYLESILDLEEEIFKTMDMLKYTSMTNAGQCRLKPLIPCIQDAVPLYDFLTKILFRLHAKLSPDVLNGHRDRFQKVFRRLQEFFKKTMNLQYFKNQIDIQGLPNTPPNFRNQYELDNYQPSRLRILNSEKDMTDAHSDTISESEHSLVAIDDTNGSNSPDPGIMTMYLEKERHIKELEHEVERLTMDSKRFINSAGIQFQQLQLEIDELKRELNDKAKLLIDKEMELKQVEDHVCKIPDEFLEQLEKAKANEKSLDEKFTKLKELYTNLRTEHIQLLRKNATVEKELMDAMKLASINSNFASQFENLQKEKRDLETQLQTEIDKKSDECTMLHEHIQQIQSYLHDIETAKDRVEKELLKTQVNTSEENFKFQESILALENTNKDNRREMEELEVNLREEIGRRGEECQILQNNLEILKLKNETLEAEKKSTELELQRTLNSNLINMSDFQGVKLVLETSNMEIQREKEELQTRLTADIRKIKDESEDFKVEIIKVNSKLQAVESSKGELETELKETLKKKTKDIEEFQAFKIILENANMKLNKQLDEQRSKLLEISNNLAATAILNQHYQNELAKLHEEIIELKRNQEITKLADANSHLNFLIETFEKVIKSQLEELDNPRLTGDFSLLDYYVCRCEETPESIRRLQDATELGYLTRGALNEIILEIPAFAQDVEFLILYGGPLSRTCKDIQQGEDLVAEVRNFGSSTLEFLQLMKKRSLLDRSFYEMMTNLGVLLQKVKGLGSSFTSEQDAAEVLDKELQAMEQAIEEAAKKMQEILSNSRASHTGVQSEVNEKLIDSCSNLMNAIRLLVQRSKSLQMEIVSQGRGTASAKEFYKRNHQWTDGLISAAKAVGIGANLLLESADKAVTTKGGGFEYLIASSQEIAASTIQLVVASQVRADRSSKNLSLVKQASTGVKTATAHVMATAKDCSQLIEESEIDVGKITAHNAKRLELEEQAEVLRLESQLEKSRRRLAALRQHNYHNEDG